MEPPRIRDEAPRDKNGIPYNNKRNTYGSGQKSPVKRETPTPAQ